LTCSEFNTTWEQCQSKAGELCSQGYEVDKQLSFKESFPENHFSYPTDRVCMCQRDASPIYDATGQDGLYIDVQ